MKSRSEQREKMRERIRRRRIRREREAAYLVRWYGRRRWTAPMVTAKWRWCVGLAKKIKTKPRGEANEEDGGADGAWSGGTEKEDVRLDSDGESEVVW